MSSTFGKWHGLAVEMDGEDVAIDILHPSECRWSTEFIPRTVDERGVVLNEAFYVQTYCCDMGHEMREWGAPEFGIKEPGMYWARVEHIVHPSGPWGGTEYDTQMEWTVATPPTVQVVPG